MFILLELSAVNVGDVVTMTNTDTTGIHTFTAGTVDGFTPTPTGEFDTGIHKFRRISRMDSRNYR